MPVHPPISIAIFVNPLAGDGRFVAVRNAILQYLQKNAIDFILFDRDWPHTLPICTHIFLVGGDGTINFFINEYPFCKIPVSVFKAGTGNDFAWKLYGNLPLGEQITLGIHGAVKSTDAGMCNGRLFVNGLGIGFDGAVVNDMKRSLKIFTGTLAYYYSVIRMINGYRSGWVRINEVPQRAFMITVANGSRFGGDFMVAPQAVLDDGSLDLITIGQVPVLQRYRYLPRMKKGRHLSLPFIKVDKINSLRISAPEPLHAHLDGEYFTDRNFEISIHAGRFNFRC